MIIDAFKKCFAANNTQSLFMTASPVFIGTSMALGDGIEHFMTSLVVLFGSLIFHIGVLNLNQYLRLKRDGFEVFDQTAIQINPTHSDIVRSTKWISIIAFACSIPAYYYLVSRCGSPMVLILVFGIIAIIIYNLLDFLSKWRVLQDVIVLIFLGPVAVSATYFVQSFEMNFAVFCAGFAPGLIAVAILSIKKIYNYSNENNEGLCSFWGRDFQLYKYLFSIISASLIPIFIYSVTRDHLRSLVAAGISLLLIPTVVKIIHGVDRVIFKYATDSAYSILLVY